MLNVGLATDCTVGETLTSIEVAFKYFSELPEPVPETEVVPVEAAMGRVLAEDVVTAMALPPFDHSAVDGFGVSEFDLDHEPPLRLNMTGRLAAGGGHDLPLQASETVRLLTGAAIPKGVRGVVLEERCDRRGKWVSIGVPVASGANIRRRGEDVPYGSTIVEAAVLLDARHIAIFVAAGVRSVTVRRKVRVAVLSNGNELCSSARPLDVGWIYDANRPMLLALLSVDWIDVIDAGCHRDSLKDLTRAFGQTASDADIVISTGGVSGSDADHVANAVTAAGGSVRPLRLALKPGKPILGGRMGRAAILGLPGNTVAALVNFMLFGRSMISAAAGLTPSRPLGQAALTADEVRHGPGRTEFVPVRAIDSDQMGRPIVEKLAKGGSARLRPLVLADGLAELPSDQSDLPAGSAVAFHAFKAAFAP